ncbi:uncharacterized protein N7479_005410 [Penicillium vulpinum]|uniref:Uncharacterized protein n=1 Tax=Penicillium vulpinum TaxID=29845 RepID=A0A1V6SDN0_9EURO|nr:uncharacterized protein N7479_005410 [Penicillium vulpinum]KAJ5958260.1 hypothetical protein N7479_005410 [Penicillium vulpinum]OQE12111.1 hypothetical protein PENVUL_c001G00551 [Penicillium vulpinum]
MVLLTSSSVSAILSMGVICIFTILLFFSGYVLQQQSVKNIQHALKPQEAAQMARHKTSPAFQKPLKRGLSDTDYGADEDTPIGSQRNYDASGNYAYLQMLSEPDPSDICSAILFFKQLSTNGTAVQDRLFIYPEQWDRMSAKKLGQSAAKALSILRAASAKYNIWLLPIDMSAATAAGYSTTNSKLLHLGQIQFMQYDSVLYVQTPGLLLDTGKLDDMLLDRPLPLRHDKNRPESYNNEAWIPMPLRANREADLPPVYLITVNNIENGHIEARTHVPNVALPGFGGLVVGAQRAAKVATLADADQPGYVYFDNDRDGRVKWANNPYFGTWRSQQAEVCEGLDFDEIIHDEQ